MTGKYVHGKAAPDSYDVQQPLTQWRVGGLLAIAELLVQYTWIVAGDRGGVEAETGERFLVR